MTEKKRSKIPYIFFGFFIIVVIVNFLYIYIANKTWRGIATEDSYYKGINYNKVLELVKIQKDLGWKITLKYNKETERGGTLLVDVFDKNQKQITDAIVYVNFKRPTQDGFDFMKTLNFRDGFYKSDIRFPLPGQWEVDVKVMKGEDVAHEVRRYLIK
jgi:nitrogen fixation protein FixH